MMGIIGEEIGVEKIWYKSYPEEIPYDIDVDQLGTINDVFNEAAEKYKNHKGFTSVKTVQTYGETKEKIDQFTSFLQHELGIKKGDRIAIMLPNSLQYPIALFAILQAGAIVVNINPLYTARELTHQLKDSQPKAIIIIENFAHTLELVQKEGLPFLQHIVLTKIGDQLHSFYRPLLNFVIRFAKTNGKPAVPKYRLQGNVIPFNKALKLGKNEPPRKVVIKNTDLAFLQYTGGTTGIAKGAMLTHRNICANMAQADACIVLYNVEKGKEVVMTPLPLYHIFSLTVNIMVFLRIGGQNVLIANPMDTKMFVNQMKRYPTSGLSGVNTLFNNLVHHADFKSVDFSTWKVVMGGGAAIQKSVAEKWKQITGLPIMEAYGLTEASPGVAVNFLVGTEANKDSPWKSTIGLPLPSTEVSIRDEEGNEVPVGEVGILWVKGPQVMQGYWNKPEETAEILQEGWLNTGDIARMDENGYLYLVDRQKDLIMVSGFNVYPNELEEVLMMHPKVKEVAVIGVRHHKSGEAPKAFVVLHESQAVVQDELITFCRQYLTSYKVPKIYEFREGELPKSIIGKILRKDLRNEEQAAYGDKIY